MFDFNKNKVSAFRGARLLTTEMVDDLLAAVESDEFDPLEANDVRISDITAQQKGDSIELTLHAGSLDKSNTSDYTWTHLLTKDGIFVKSNYTDKLTAINEAHPDCNIEDIVSEYKLASDLLHLAQAHEPQKRAVLIYDIKDYFNCSLEDIDFDLDLC